MIAQFNSTGVRYCILSGCDDDPAAIRPMWTLWSIRRYTAYPAVLTQSARSAGAQLIQAIHHEIAGCYFILAKQDGQQTDSWIRLLQRLPRWPSLAVGNQVIAGRRVTRISTCRGPRRVLYYLIKKY